MTCFPWVWGSTLVHREKKLCFTNVLPRVKTRVSKEDQGTHRFALRTDFGSTFPAPGISLPCGKLSEKRERAFLTNREPGRSFSSTYPVF